LESVSIQLAIRSVARFSAVPYLMPLKLALEDHPRVAIALVSQEDLRLMTLVLSEIETKDRIHGHVPGRQRQGGWSAFKYQRDRERHVHQQFASVVEELSDLNRRLPFKWLVIAGTDEATSAVTSLLPGSLRHKLAGTFRDELFETDGEVARKGALLAEEAERSEELRLAETIRDRALGGGPATLGWDKTLQTLREGRVHELAIAGTNLATSDADLALELAADSDARVEIIHGDAEALLAPNGGIGALLRY
jgi:peptide subunit release factor 1 (eRF1)